MSKLYLISCGPGSPEDITVKALRAIDDCDMLFGSYRLLKLFAGGKPAHSVPADPVQTAAIINDCEYSIVGVLLSGDAGFHSAAKGLRELVIGRDIISIAGISIVQAATATLNIGWDKLDLISLHSGEKAMPELRGSSLVLMRQGLELSTMNISERYEVWIIRALGTENEKVQLWNREKYICDELTTLVLIELFIIAEDAPQPF